jgi:hypothetical protein
LRQAFLDLHGVGLLIGVRMVDALSVNECGPHIVTTCTLMPSPALAASIEYSERSKELARSLSTVKVGSGPVPGTGTTRLATGVVPVNGRPYNVILPTFVAIALMVKPWHGV